MIERLLALTARKPGDVPFQNGGPHLRASSPSGRSTLMTSAPRCARISPAIGPASACPISTTRTPSSIVLIRSRGGPRNGPPHPPTLGAPRGTRGAPRPHACSSEQRARDDHAVHLRGPLADAAPARLAIPALQRKLLGHAVAAVDLHGGVYHAAEHLARVQLGDRRLHARVLAAIGLPRALPDQPAARAQLDLRVGEHPLDRLALAQLLAERLALLGVLDGHAMRGDGDPEVRRGVREAILHEEVERQVEPLPFLADQRVGGQHAVLEHDVVGDRGGADRADVLPREARRARLDDEARDAAPPAADVAAPQAMLRHLLGDPRHPDRLHPAAAVVLRRGEGPEARGPGLLRQTLEVLVGNARRVGIEPMLERDDLLADEAPNLLADEPQLVGQREAGEGRHGGTPSRRSSGRSRAARGTSSAWPRPPCLLYM